MGKLTQLKKKQNEAVVKIYPITIAEGVVFSDGNNLTGKTGSITISKNGGDAQTFTELSGQNLLVDLDIPTDDHVTSVNNHYTPTGGSIISASGATPVSGTTQVISGIKIDAAGHITDIESAAVISGANNSVSGSSLTDNNIVLGGGGSSIKDSNKNIVTVITGSNNIPTDSAVKNYVDNNCQSTITFDSTPTSGSTNPVTSDGIYAEFQNCLVADNIEEISISSDTYYTKTQSDSRFIRSESDPIFTNSVAYNIAASDISNWNAKTSNIGTITGITMNGSSVGTHGNIDLGTVVTALPSTETWTFELENGTTVTKTIYIA